VVDFDALVIEAIFFRLRFAAFFPFCRRFVDALRVLSASFLRDSSATKERERRGTV